jgi:fluoride exporter
MTLILVALGGAIGSVCRYLLSTFVHQYSPAAFPYGTFLVNILGCALFGVIVGLAEQRIVMGPLGRAFLLVGVLGGFTTFSAFTFETLELLKNAAIAHAALNVIGQVAIGLGGLWLGYLATKL